MCGRFAQATALDKLEKLLEISEQLIHPPPRYNVAPSSQVVILRQSTEQQVSSALLQWGLIPFWAKDPRIGFKMINAKAETLLDKPSFRGPFRYRRCVIPVDGFYEWTRTPDGKQPWYIRQQNEQPLFLAGLWDHWETPEQTIESFTIITREADAQIQPIHHRMPVILSSEDIPAWIDKQQQQPQRLYPLMQHVPDLSLYKVSKAVNSPRHEGPALLHPIEQEID